MTHPSPESGYLRSGLPCNRAGRGPRPLVIFPGLTFENKPQFGTLSMYKFLQKDYTLFGVYRRPGMPKDCSLRDMGDDYAAMIRQEFGGPVEVLGVSTGGSIALHFAADHPDLVRRLVIHSSAHTLNADAKALQLGVARLAQQGRWRGLPSCGLSFHRQVRESGSRGRSSGSARGCSH